MKIHYRHILGILIIGLGLILFKLMRLSMVGEPGHIVVYKQYAAKIIAGLLIFLGLYCILNKKRSRLIKIFLICLGILISLFTAEIYFRVFNPQIVPNQQDKLFTYNSIYGWSFIPDKKARVVSYGEFDTEVKINSIGIRDREYTVEKLSGIKRIAVLGDSIVSALQVYPEQIFTYLLEQKSENTQVMNFGVPGYGPTQELLFLQTEILKYKPDKVILVLSVGTDFDDLLGTYDWNFGYHRPKAVLKDQSSYVLENIPVAKPPAVDLKPVKYLPDSHLVQFLSNLLYQKTNLKNLNVDYEIRFFKKNPPPEIMTAADLLKLELEEFKQICINNNAELIIIIAPTIVQVYDKIFWPKIVNEYHLDNEQYDLTYPNQMIINAAQTKEIKYLDLLPSLRQASEKEKNLYFYKDRHWTASGHKKVSQEVYNFLSTL